MYKLKYLPLVQKDLRDITAYIIDKLKAPKAAMDLVDALDNSISRLQQFPYSCQVYRPIEPLEAEYRMLPVKNDGLKKIIIGKLTTEVIKFLNLNREPGNLSFASGDSLHRRLSYRRQ